MGHGRVLLQAVTVPAGMPRHAGFMGPLQIPYSLFTEKGVF